MGVESVLVAEVLSYAETLETSFHSLIAWSTAARSAILGRQKLPIEATQRTFANKITEVQHLNCLVRLHKLKLYSRQRRREIYMIIYIGRYHNNGSENKRNRSHPRHGTQLCVIEYRVLNKQKLGTIPSRICNNCLL